MIIDAALKLQEQTGDKTEDHDNNEVTEPELTNSSTNSSRDVNFNIMYRFENKIFAECKTVDVFSSEGNSTESTQCFSEISTSNITYDSYNTFTTCMSETSGICLKWTLFRSHWQIL